MAGTPVQTLRCEINLNPAASSREHIVNVWHIATVGSATPIQAADAFFSTINAFYQSIDAYLSSELDASVPLMRVFNLIENKPRQPIKEYQFTALNTGEQQAQREAAICLSYRAEYVSGVSPKRRRGRIYLGPWSSGVVDGSTGKFSSEYRTPIVTAAQALIDAHQLASAWSWVVYSPTTDEAGTGETGMYEVIQAWVDDEVDTQRRRGKPQPGVKYVVA